MNKWKELKIDDLPRDILVGDYDFEKQQFSKSWEASIHANVEDRGSLLSCAINENIKYRYCKRQPKAPTHEEIMTSNKYWEIGDGVWSKVNGYNSETKQYYVFIDEHTAFPRKEWFIGRKAADIPPEAE